MKDRYLAEEGSRSKSGKTIVRIAKSGRKYYHNPNKYDERKTELRLERESKGVNTKGEYSNQRVKAICYDKDSLAYMRYFEKKCSIRGEYPKWVFMSREQHMEYFNKIWELLQSDDFKHFLHVDNKTLLEKEEDAYWERKLQKEKDYNGSGDEYR